MRGSKSGRKKSQVSFFKGWHPCRVQLKFMCCHYIHKSPVSVFVIDLTQKFKEIKGNPTIKHFVFDLNKTFGLKNRF